MCKQLLHNLIKTRRARNRRRVFAVGGMRYVSHLRSDSSGLVRHSPCRSCLLFSEAAEAAAPFAEMGKAMTAIVFKVFQASSCFSQEFCRVIRMTRKRLEGNAVPSRITIEHDPKRD